MKPVYLLLVCLVFLSVTNIGCTHKTIVHSKSGKLPPGQVKKATGSKSAKPYTPGQQKKN